MNSLGVGIGIFIAIVVGSIVLAVATWLLKALTLRCACDLWALDPSPSFFRCLGITTLLWPALSAIMFGAMIVGGMLSSAFKPSPENAPIASFILAMLGFLPLSAIVTMVVLLLAFRPQRVGFVCSFVVWLLDTLLFGLIGVVLALLIVGSITVVQSVNHGLSVLF